MTMNARLSPMAAAIISGEIAAVSGSELTCGELR